MSYPVLELANVSLINRKLRLISSVAALKNGEALVHYTMPYGGTCSALINGKHIDTVISNEYMHRVVKVNQQGEALHNVEHRVYAAHTERTGRGLLVLGNMLYVIQTTPLSVEKIKLPEFQKSYKGQQTVVKPVDKYRVPGAVNFGSLFHDPSMIPDKDLLLLADQITGEIFTYRLSTRHKEVHVTGLKNPTSVSYILTKEETFYLVCDSQRVRVYNSTWRLVRYIGKPGSADGALSKPTSAIMLPEGSIIIADQGNNRVSEFTVMGKFLCHLLTEDDEVINPTGLSFSYPHLWVLHHDNRLHRYKLYVS